MDSEGLAEGLAEGLEDGLAMALEEKQVLETVDSESKIHMGHTQH